MNDSEIVIWALLMTAGGAALASLYWIERIGTHIAVIIEMEHKIARSEKREPRHINEVMEGRS